jgi:hypothetical protein
MAHQLPQQCVGVALLLALVPAPAAAYGTDTHEYLTREAVALIHSCKQETSALLDPTPHVATLVDFNLGQDDLMRKARLWHFPFVPRADCSDACGTACYTTSWCPYWLSFICGMEVYRSFDPWLNQLLSQAKLAHAPSEVYPAAGALLHYLQDLAVPAHALPIFHPVPLWHGDELDNYEVRATHDSLLKSRGRKAVCQTLTDTSEPRALLVDMRQKTLASLDSEFPAQSKSGNEHRWRVFWPSIPDPQAREFQSYGCDDGFGASSVRCGEDTFEVDDKTYQRFADARAEDAILASAQLIARLQTQLAQADAGSKRASADDPDERWLPSAERLERIARQPSLCVPLWPRDSAAR